MVVVVVVVVVWANVARFTSVSAALCAGAEGGGGGGKGGDETPRGLGRKARTVSSEALRYAEREREKGAGQGGNRFARREATALKTNCNI